MIQNISELLSKELAQLVPTNVAVRVNEVLQAFQKQATDYMAEKERSYTDSLNTAREKLDDMTRKWLETEMKVLKLQEEANILSQTGQSDRIKPVRYRNLWQLRLQMRASTERIKSMESDHKRLESQLKFLINSSSSERRDLSNLISEQAAELERLRAATESQMARNLSESPEIASLRKSIAGYQEFIYRKEKECYSLTMVNSGLSIEISSLKQYKERYSALYELYFRNTLRFVDVQAQLKEQQIFIKDRESFFESCITPTASHGLILSQLQNISNILGELSGKGLHGHAPEAENKDLDLLKDFNILHKEAGEVRSRIKAMRDVFEGFRIYLSGLSIPGNTDLEACSRENAILKAENRRQQTSLDSVVGGQSCRADSIPMSISQLESELDSYKKELRALSADFEQYRSEYNESSMECILSELRNHKDDLANYQNYIQKQNELLDRYRQLKRVFLSKHFRNTEGNMIDNRR